jgi:hypothetical protein
MNVRHRIALLLGIFFDQINERIKRDVNYLFFRKQFHAEAALAQFSGECGYISSADVPVDRTLVEVLRHVGALAAGMYEYTGDGYCCLQQRGSLNFPNRLAIDDPSASGCAPI